MTFSEIHARSHEPYLRADLLRALGRNAEAARWFESLALRFIVPLVYRASARIALAQLYEEMGDTARAVEMYRGFARDDPAHATACCISAAVVDQGGRGGAPRVL